MRWLTIVSCALVTVILSSGVVQAADDVATYSVVWHDTARDRDVPVKVYYPRTATGTSPVIIFSHGLGGSRDGYSYLGEYWAAHGYVSVHPQHIGSDDSIWKNAKPANTETADTAKPGAEPQDRNKTREALRERMRARSGEVAANPAPGATGFSRDGILGGAISAQTVTDRVKDVSFVIDELTKSNTDAKSPLHGRLDLSKIGMAGHSFGGNTTMFIAGQAMPIGGKNFADPRIKAAIAMSPPPPQREASYKTAYGSIKLPLMIMTGTEDNMPESRTANEDRHKAFPYLTASPAAYIVTFEGGDHMLFGGQRFGGKDKSTDAAGHELIQKTTTTFWDAYLRDDAAAKKDFSDGAVAKMLGNAAEIEARK